MSADRLPSHVEVASIVRRAQADGDFATVLRKGDPERGSLLVVISSRGRHVACLERILAFDKGYVWQASGPGDSAKPQEVADFLAKRTRFDDDLWAVELDIAEPERFIAETMLTG